MRQSNVSFVPNPTDSEIYHVTYPDEVMFAFNPCIFTIEGNLKGATVIFYKVGGVMEELLAVPMHSGISGKVTMDVREYVQYLFERGYTESNEGLNYFGDVDYENVQKSGLATRVSYSIAVEMADGTVRRSNFMFEGLAIWGALKIGGDEVFNAFRTVTWFRNYPFTFSIYAHGGGSILFCKDGVASRFVNINERGLWNVPLLSDDDVKGFYLIKDCTGAFVEMTFDTTFDLTFRYSGGGVKTDKLRINVDDSDTGIYLRWINRHGMYSYWLFKKGTESHRTSMGEYMLNNLKSYDMKYGYQGAYGKRQRVERSQSVAVCAPLVDSDTWDLLMDVASSPMVDMFMGYEDGEPRWMSVSVNGGTIEKTGEVLQDFEIEINLPDVAVQSF